MWSSLVCVFLVTLVTLIHAQSPQQNQENIDSICSVARDCGECMQAHPECHWCVAENFKDSLYGRNYRCASYKTLVDRECAKDKIEASRTTFFESEEAENNQFVPTKQTLSIRPNQMQVLNVTFNQIKNYPVDLYYLTDISYSMKDDLKTVSDLALDIAKSMQTLTSEFRIGFGSFVDKPVFPFVEERVLTDPCFGTGYEGVEKCDPPYVLQHFLPLTSNISLFQEKTRSANASGNIDAPEGGLDALMQVALCDDIIGWKDKARKIVLLTTDGCFHVAGDGRLAGLIQPPPLECRMYHAQDRNRPSLQYMGYHDSIYYDYPSVGELARVLDEKKINVIFAVIGNYTQLYSRLADLLPVAKVGAITNRSENIVNLIRENYQKIASTVTLNSQFEEEFLKVNVFARCHADTEFRDQQRCEDHPLGKSIEYQVKIEVKKCFSGTKTVKLALSGFKDVSYIDVQSACECPSCLKTPPSSELSEKCNKQGTFACGKCTCVPGLSGDFCECRDQEGKTEAQLSQECRLNSLNNEICSGHGRCECGRCKCNNERYQGEFCQCDTNLCRRASDNNEVCGGKLRGTCNCNGQCKCEAGYTGAGCDCMISDTPCYDYKNVSCSGHGHCDCGVCMCHSGWGGEKCDVPSDADNVGLCQNDGMKQCVLCNQANSHAAHNLTDQCNMLCDLPNVTLEITTVNEKPGTTPGMITCVTFNSQNCRIIFTYTYSHEVFQKRKVRVNILKTAECPALLNIVWIVLGVVLGVLLIGIVVLLVWKLVVTIDDKREMARFVKEEQNAKWEMEENPIFKEPVTTVVNPTYKEVN